mmetsp:Transcript_83642/g.139604  ORF Transcript_83642/g.139604 Transcript_83642/m.139604 type:complete len:80 (-) Transcript_83642:35-274(-)
MSERDGLSSVSPSSKAPSQRYVASTQQVCSGLQRLVFGGQNAPWQPQSSAQFRNGLVEDGRYTSMPQHRAPNPKCAMMG